MTSYSQRGASLPTSAPGGSQVAGITTTDRPGRAGYVNGDINPSFTGTSSAAPEVTAVVAWTSMNPVAQTFHNEVHLSATAAGQAVPANAAGTRFTFAVTGSEIVENADLTLNVATANLDHLKVVLTSASGTQSIVLDTSFTPRGEYVVNHASGVTALAPARSEAAHATAGARPVLPVDEG
ncbi:MAG: hypothetical protein ABW058_16215 [Methylobacterium sp.]